MSTALPPELSPRDQRRRLFFWLGVAVLPVFWSWFTLGRRFSKWQRKLAFGWMGAHVVFLACSHEWFVSRGQLLADIRVSTAFMSWVLWGLVYWVMLHKFGLFEVLFISWCLLLKMVMDTVGPFLHMLLGMVLARIALAIWEKSLARAQMARCDASPA